MESFEFGCAGKELARVLGNAARFTAGPLMPIMEAVWLECRADGTVSASATDRYTAYSGAFLRLDTPIDGLLPADVWAGAAPVMSVALGPDAVKTLITAGRAAQVVTVTVTAGHVSAESESGQVVVSVESGFDRPGFDKIAAGVFGRPQPREVEPVGLDLAKLAKITGCKTTPLTPVSRGRAPMVRTEFRFGSERDCVAALMPGAVALIMPVKAERS